MDEQTIEKVKVKAMSSLLHRNVLGGLGMLLPVFSIIGGLFVKNKPVDWWYSISVTYYITPALPIILGACAIFLLCYRSYEKIDTIINDIPLTLYIPHNATAELSVGKPNIHDKDIILIAQAADIRGDNYKILGAFVLKGKPLAWGLSKKGFCAIINEEMTVGTSENSPLFEKATETDGYFFRQFSLVNEGVLVENELKNKSIRKALCSRLGENFIAVTETPESFHDFAQALVDLGVENAIALVGSSSAFGWYIDENGNQTLFGEDIHKYKNENYILWKH